MSDLSELLQNLREAVAARPDDLRLRQSLARTLMKQGAWAEALEHLKVAAVDANPDVSVRVDLARCLSQTGSVSAALAVVESVLGQPGADGPLHLLHARLLLRTGDLDGAAAAYQLAVRAQPALADPHLAEALNIPALPPAPRPAAKPRDDSDRDTSFDPDDDFDFDDDVDDDGRIRVRRGDEEPDAPLLLERPNIDFSDVGGMDQVKDQIRIKIIEPMKRPDLYQTYGKTAGGGILMYGPPGCGKTLLARATAGQVEAHFLAVGLHDVLDMYLGNSERRLHSLFEQARRHTPCVLFFDEVDALAASRSDLRQSAGRQLINQFLAELDGVTSDNQNVLILAATNAPWHLDSAFRRPGRFDRILFVPPPDAPARLAVLRVMLAGKPIEQVDLDAVARKTDGFSGADLKAVVDLAVEEKLRQALASGQVAALVTRDLLKAVKQVKPSTRDWFASARNYALYANDSGLYDDVLAYLKLL